MYSVVAAPHTLQHTPTHSNTHFLVTFSNAVFNDVFNSGGNLLVSSAVVNRASSGALRSNQIDRRLVDLFPGSWLP